MSMERRSEIYVTRKLAKRLRSVITLYQPMTTVQHERDRYNTMDRLMTVEELVERHLNKIIEEKYPVVVELEKGYAKLEREMAAHAKKCATKTSGTKPPTTDDDSLISSSHSLEDGD